MAMEDLSSLFSYQESVDELKQKLFYMTSELQSVRMQASEEARKNQESTENMRQLLHLLQLAHKERDEVKEQLQKLLLENNNNHQGSPLFNSNNNNNNHQRKTSSGVTESNNSYSSQGDSLYDVISPVIKDFASPVAKTIDPETQIIYDLAKGKALPQKGKLLQSVMEAGPLLQTLMVAGSLPRWRNPPPLRPLQVPPVGISAFDGIKNEYGPSSLKRPLNNHASGGYAKLPCGSSEFLTNYVLNFSAGGAFGTAGVCLNTASGLASSTGFIFGSQMMIPTPKRQRIQ